MRNKFSKAWSWFEHIPTLDWILQVLGVRNMIIICIASVLGRVYAHLKSWPWWLSEIFTGLVIVFILLLLLIFIGYIIKKKKDKDAQLEEPIIVAKDKYISSTAKKLVSSFIYIIFIGAIFMLAYALYLYKVPPQEKPIQQKQIERKKALPPRVSKKIPVVYEPFRPAYEIHKTKLGNPLPQGVQEDQVYEASHYNAIVIGSAKLSKYYVLDNQNSKWREYPDVAWDIDNYSEWINDALIIQRLHLPKGCKPPYCGVAVLWSRDEKNWKWIGCRLWHCFYKNIHYQKFEHGMIIGNFPKNYKSLEHAALFVLTDDFQWDGQESGHFPASQCVAPPNELPPGVLDSDIGSTSTIGNNTGSFPTRGK
jgi:hypothetical protein